MFSVQSLIPFMSAILAKKYSNYSFDVISLLAGSLEQSHAVFTVSQFLVFSPLDESRSRLLTGLCRFS